METSIMSAFHSSTVWGGGWSLQKSILIISAKYLLNSIWKSISKSLHKWCLMLNRIWKLVFFPLLTPHTKWIKVQSYKYIQHYTWIFFLYHRNTCTTFSLQEQTWHGNIYSNASKTRPFCFQCCVVMRLYNNPVTALPLTSTSECTKTTQVISMTVCVCDIKTIKQLRKLKWAFYLHSKFLGCWCWCFESSILFLTDYCLLKITICCKFINIKARHQFIGAVKSIRSFFFPTLSCYRCFWHWRINTDVCSGKLPILANLDCSYSVLPGRGRNVQQSHRYKKHLLGHPSSPVTFPPLGEAPVFWPGRSLPFHIWGEHRSVSQQSKQLTPVKNKKAVGTIRQL